MKLKLLALIVSLQVALIVGMALVQEHKLSRGTEILLETLPVDPRDLLRGDFVILNYKISDVAWDRFSPPLTKPLAPGDTVYVVLEKHAGFHEVVNAFIRAPKATGDQVVLKGRSLQRRWASGSSEHMEYGLERYFVAEGTGNPTGKVTVQVAVPKSGTGAIKQVFIDGKPYAEVMKSVNP